MKSKVRLEWGEGKIGTRTTNMSVVVRVHDLTRGSAK